jgi:hypothetical protein
MESKDRFLLLLQMLRRRFEQRGFHVHEASGGGVSHALLERFRHPRIVMLHDVFGHRRAFAGGQLLDLLNDFACAQVRKINENGRLGKMKNRRAGAGGQALDWLKDFGRRLNEISRRNRAKGRRRKAATWCHAPNDCAMVARGGAAFDEIFKFLARVAGWREMK